MAAGLEMSKGNEKPQKQQMGRRPRVVANWEVVPTISPLWRRLWDLLLHNGGQGKPGQLGEGFETETPLGQSDGEDMLTGRADGDGGCESENRRHLSDQ